MALPRLNDVVSVASLSSDAYGNAGEGELYCPTCGALRRMSIIRLHWESRAISYAGTESEGTETGSSHSSQGAAALFVYGLRAEERRRRRAEEGKFDEDDLRPPEPL